MLATPNIPAWSTNHSPLPTSSCKPRLNDKCGHLSFPWMRDKSGKSLRSVRFYGLFLPLPDNFAQVLF